MADSYSKKEREKKKAQKKKDKELRKAERQSEGKQTELIMYVDAYGNFTENKPDEVSSEIDQMVGFTNKESVPREYKGSIKLVNIDQGFGFIKASGKLGDIYFVIPENKIPPLRGQKVIFDIKRTSKGLNAYNLRY